MIGPDDVVQEAVLRGIRQLHRFEFRHNRAFLAYLLTAIRHRIVDEVRKVRRRPAFVPLGEHEHADLALSPLERIIAREDLTCCAAAFARLSERDRQLIALRVRRMRYADIAVWLDLNTSEAARMAVTRALNRLAKSLQREAESCARQRACNPRS
jgi:RNA polymerase sigma factor (sigma-70 family)